MSQLSSNSTAPFECVLQTRWSDQDLLGHINNARILTLAEEARVLATRAWAGAAPDGNDRRVVRTMNVLFDRALHYGEDVLAKVWVSRIGTTSFTLAHELWQSGQRGVWVECVMVMLDSETGRSTPLTDEQRASLEPHLMVADQR